MLYELFLFLIIWILSLNFGRSWITLNFFSLQNVIKNSLVRSLILSIRTIIGLIWLAKLIRVELMFVMNDILNTSLWLKHVLIIYIVMTTLFLNLIHGCLHLVTLHYLFLHLGSFLKVFVLSAFKVLYLIAMKLFIIVKRLDFCIFL